MANHGLFQLANAFLLLSYISHDVLMLRLVLMLAGISFVLFGTIAFLPSVSKDTVAWNSIFTVINAYRASELIWQRRPIKFEREEHEGIYQEVFGPLGIGRLQFKMLMEQGLMRGLRSGTTFIEAGNEASNLTLIYRGTMTIISSPKDGRQPEPVGAVHRMQFVESPQWANIQVQRRKKAAAAIKAKKASKLKTQGSKQITAKTGATVDDKFTESDIEAQLQETGEEARTSIMKDDDVKAASTVEVTFKAATDVVFFMWRMERLQDFLEKNTALMAPLNAIVGADVAAKLFSQAKAGGEIDTMSMQRRIYLPLDDTPAPAILPRENSKSKLEGTDEIIGTDDGHHEEESGMDESEESASPLQAEKLWLEQRGEKDTKNDHKLARILRQRTDLDRYELSALISKGRWHRILRADTVLIREGEPMTKLYMILRGKLSVFKGEDEHARLLHNILPQQLAGSIEWSELGREHIAGETVVSVEPCIYIAWDLDDLRIFLGPRPKIRAQLTALLASDLAAKFRQVVEDTQ